MSPQFAAAPADAGDLLAGPRKAALLLHAMPTEHRLWLLEQLPASEREPLEGLLAELQELGIPADGALLREILSEADTRNAASGEAQASRAQLAILERAGPGSLWLAVRDEPAGLIARVLALVDGHWEADFLQQIDTGKRQQVIALLTRYRSERRNRPPAPDLLGAHLLATLSERVSGSHLRWVLDQALPFSRPDRARKWWRSSRSSVRGASGAESSSAGAAER